MAETLIESPQPAVDGQKQRTPWHAFDADGALERLDTSIEGLSNQEAAQRLETHGPNRLPQAESESVFKRLLRQFNDVLIYVLLAAAVVTALLGEWIDTGVILGVVVINALIGFIQEGKAEAALESIRSMLSLHAVVVRDDRRRDIEADELVPGDIVLVESGDRVPADLRILRARNLQVEEAALTGESQPVDKGADAVAEEASLGDRHSMLFSGTTITRGQARCVVVETGVDTEIGQIGEMISSVTTLTTPLIRAINDFGKKLSLIILLIAALAFAFGYFFRPFTVEELFLIIVGLAVASIPEGLPAIMTITLALGVQRMARRNAILRRLPAVETLGSVTVICSDKTGTLTRNEMTVARVLTSDGLFAVAGSGYSPEGEILLEDRQPGQDQRARLAELARSGVLASDAVLRQENDQWHIDGDPTEGALIVLGEKMGYTQDDLHEQHERLDAIPFESENQYMATLTSGQDGRVVHVKGSPERILAMCSRQRGAEGNEALDRAAWEERTARLAAEGHRMLAIAWRTEFDREAIEPADADQLTLLGIVGIIDPPRPEAIEAVAECREAGIRVVMITGDHALTARAIGKQMGIGDGTRALKGVDLQAMSEEELLDAAQEYDVFARTSPEHKLRLVEALQTRGHVVAMTGDGVNDAPALKRADVGVAMGIKGAEASKDAADMVLADDNFATIASAVREGRTIYDNLKKTILFILPTNGAEALLVLATLVFAFAQLPITPLQILWVNMVTAVTLALALAFEPSEPGVMRRPPREASEAILSGYLVWRIAFVSVLIGSAALALFFREVGMGSGLELSQTVAVNVLVVGQFFYLFNSRFIRSSTLSWSGIFGNPYALLAGGILLMLQAGFTYLPIFNLWFGTEGLPLDRWLWINSAGLAVFFIVEGEKGMFRWIQRRRDTRDAAATSTQESSG